MSLVIDQLITDQFSYKCKAQLMTGDRTTLQLLKILLGL